MRVGHADPTATAVALWGHITTPFSWGPKMKALAELTPPTLSSTDSRSRVFGLLGNAPGPSPTETQSLPGAVASRQWASETTSLFPVLLCFLLCRPPAPGD